MGQETSGAATNGSSPANTERRRAHLRFEVMGPLSASLLSTQPLHVVNLSACGVLAEGLLPLPPNAEYQMQFVLGSVVSGVTVKVRRATAVYDDLGVSRYRIGLEFLDLAIEVEEAIHEFVVTQAGV